MNKFKKLSIRDFTQNIAKVLLDGGEVVIYKGKDPYRYMNIREIKVERSGVITDEEAKERQGEAYNQSNPKSLLEVDLL